MGHLELWSSKVRVPPKNIPRIVTYPLFLKLPHRLLLLLLLLFHHHDRLPILLHRIRLIILPLPLIPPIPFNPRTRSNPRPPSDPLPLKILFKTNQLTGAILITRVVVVVRHKYYYDNVLNF